jgi:hypothetical protein
MICDCGSRVLDLIVCEACGDVFLGGYRAKKKIGSALFEWLTADEPDLDSMPDQQESTVRHGDYAVFWPQPFATVQPVDDSWTATPRSGGQSLSHRWRKAQLDPVTGQLDREQTGNEISPRQASSASR